MKIPKRVVDEVRHCLHSYLPVPEEPAGDQPRYVCQKDVPQTSPKGTHGPLCVLLQGPQICRAWRLFPERYDT